MKKLFYLVLAAGLVFALVGCQNSKVIEKGVVLNGTGFVLANPDLADFNISIKTTGKADDREKVIAQNAEKTDSVRRVLLKNSIKEKEISTESFSAQDYIIYSKSGKIEGKKFIVTNIINVKTSNLKKVSGLLGKLLMSGAASVGELNYSFSDPAKLEAKAYANAVKDAKIKAQEVANAGGVHLLSISNVNVSSDDNCEYAVRSGMMGMGGGKMGYGMGIAKSTYIYTAPKPKKLLQV